MIKNKKGLSAVVTTLIIILLVLVAIGVVWVVVSNVVEEGASSIDYSAQCLQVDVKAVSATSCDNSACTVSLKRGNGGNDISGVKMVFSNGTDTSDVKDRPGNIGKLATVSYAASSLGMTEGPNKVEVTAYFTDASGNDKLCDQTFPFSF